MSLCYIDALIAYNFKLLCLQCGIMYNISILLCSLVYSAVLALRG